MKFAIDSIPYIDYIPIGFFFGIGMSVASTVIGWLSSVIKRNPK